MISIPWTPLKGLQKPDLGPLALDQNQSPPFGLAQGDRPGLIFTSYRLARYHVPRGLEIGHVDNCSLLVPWFCPRHCHGGKRTTRIAILDKMYRLPRTPRKAYAAGLFVYQVVSSSSFPSAPVGVCCNYKERSLVAKWCSSESHIDTIMSNIFVALPNVKRSDDSVYHQTPGHRHCQHPCYFSPYSREVL